ncbi:MAG: DUF6089 family protein [Bacteroidota bacterium]
MRSLLIVLLCLPLAVQAQYFEVGAFAGVSKYSGDLTSKLVDIDDVSLAYGALGRFNMNEYFSFRVQLTAAEISGNDNRAPLSSGRQSRALNFQSKIYEAALLGEFNFPGFDVTQDQYFSPFVFAGVSGFYHNPMAYLNNQLVDLQPLGTEGQGMEAYPDLAPYSLYQLAIPVGGGLKLNINEVVNITLEVGVRKTFTDYLDDVSGTYPDIQGLLELNPTAAALSYRAEDVLNSTSFTNPEGRSRGNPATKDWFFISGISVTFNLGTYY